MNFNNYVKNIFLKIYKLSKLIFYPRLSKFLFKGILPTFEHEEALKIIGKQNSLIDCGCNKGQFAILSFKLNKFSEYIAFDPIIYPNSVIKYFKKNNIKTHFKEVALSNKEGLKEFFITKRNDSSSLKKPKEFAFEYFADVFENDKKIVKVFKLNNFYELIKNTPEPRILKIDVQGNEFELLEGSDKIINFFEFIIIECTYFELYEEIKHNIIDVHSLLMEKNFKLVKEYNKVYRKGKLISTDRIYKFFI